MLVLRPMGYAASKLSLALGGTSNGFLAQYDGPIDGFAQIFSSAAQGANWPVEKHSRVTAWS